MKDAGNIGRANGKPRGRAVLAPGCASFAAGGPWSFVYIFFSNGTPFDAPNRSEPCPRC